MRKESSVANCRRLIRPPSAAPEGRGRHYLPLGYIGAHRDTVSSANRDRWARTPFLRPASERIFILLAAAVHLAGIGLAGGFSSAYRMKSRPDSTTSERQLLMAMAERGRPVTLVELATWRRDGLLPPLASQGRGQGRGKSYYWREEDIVAQACAAFDFLAKYSRRDTAIWMLWLSGYEVPLPQLRRAWSAHGKMRPPAKVRPALSQAEAAEPRELLGMFEPERANQASAMLLQVALMLCDTIAPDPDHQGAAVVRLIERALGRFTRRGSAMRNEATAERLWHLVQLMGSLLEAGNLVAQTCDADMQMAQHYLCVAARLLHSCADHDWQGEKQTGLWPDRLAEIAAPALAITILVLLRSGHKDTLDLIAAKIERGSRPARARPAPLYHHA